MKRLLFAVMLLCLFTRGVFSQEQPPKAEPATSENQKEAASEAKPGDEPMDEQKKIAQAVMEIFGKQLLRVYQESQRRLVKVTGKPLPHILAISPCGSLVLVDKRFPRPIKLQLGKDLPKGTHFRWSIVDSVDGQGGKMIAAEVCTCLIQKPDRVAHELALVWIATSGHKQETVIQYALSTFAQHGGEARPDLAKCLVDKGGPMSLAELRKYAASPPAKPQDQAKLQDWTSNAIWATASYYFLAYHLQQQEILQKVLNGEVSAEDLEKAMDTAKAWKAHKLKMEKMFKPAPRLPRPIFPEERRVTLLS